MNVASLPSAATPERAELPPLYLAELIRADLLRARSMSAALARNLSLVLNNADRTLPFALSRLEDLLADDVLRLLACLHSAQSLRDRLGEALTIDLAFARDCLIYAAPLARSAA